MLDFSRFETKLAAHLEHPTVGVTDVYTSLAAEAFDVPPAEVTPERRRLAKELVFLKLYGGRDSVMTRNLGLGPEDCTVAVDKFEAAFPGLRTSL